MTGRVAVVTGGTRGIGAAISIKLQENGYVVAANYGGNDERAAKFKDETGIAVYKWDVSDFDDGESPEAIQAFVSHISPQWSGWEIKTDDEDNTQIYSHLDSRKISIE